MVVEKISGFKAHSVLPGFNLALGFTLLYLSLIVLIPLSTLLFKTATLGWSGFWMWRPENACSRRCA